MVNGQELRASVDDQERTMLDLASGQLTRDPFLEWVRQHISPDQR